MFASDRQSSLRRRGVVLIVILGMLGLLALIGVTFATFSGQAKISSRHFVQAKIFPESSEVMDYALSQLVDDTSNPQSVIRGHSLRRDMYGNDSNTNGYLASRPDNAATAPNTNSLFYLTAKPQTDATTGLIVLTTNIPLNDPAFYGYNFTRWFMRVSASAGTTPYSAAQTIEILWDDTTSNYATTSGMRMFWVSGWDTTTKIVNPTVNTTAPYYTAQLADPTNGLPFILDGRYLYAFNGPGMESWRGPAGSERRGRVANGQLPV